MPGAVASYVVAAVGATGVAANVIYAVAYIATTVAISVAANAVVGKLSGSLKKAPRTPSVSGLTAELRDRVLTARQPVAPRRIIYGQSRVGGIYTFIHVAGESSEYLYLVITISGHQIQSVDEVYFDGVAIPLDGNGDATGDYAGFVHCEFNLGSPDQQAFAGLVNDVPDKWTVNHRQRGCAGVYLKLKYDPDKFPNGIPSISFLVSGKNDIYDPRSGSYGYTDNAALCCADYISNPVLGLGASYGDEIQIPDLIEAANICDEAVPKLDGGNEARYSCNGTIETDSTPYEILKNLVGCMAGAVVTQGRIWLIRAGAYRIPEINALTESDFVGQIEMQTMTPRTQLFNGVKGVFTSPDNNWQPDDFPAVSVDTYVQQDGGEKVWSEITLQLTTSVSAAQRIARHMLEIQRRQITVSVPVKTIGYKLLVWDTVPITIPRYGWDNKTFKVSGMELVFDKTWYVRLSLQEIDAGAWAWSTNDESVYTPAPRTNLPSSFVVQTPGLTLSEELVPNQTSGVVTNLIAYITPVSNAFTDRYQTQFRIVGGDWVDMGNSDALIHKASNVQDLATYEVRVRAINTLGVKSPWSDTKTINIVGQTDIPPDVEIFNINIVDSTATLSWLPVDAIDISHYTIKYSTALSGATWSSSSVLVQQVAKNSSTVSVPALSGTYLIKAVDYGGRESENPALITSNVIVVQNYDVIEQLIESPNYPGTHVQTLASSLGLQLDYQDDVFERVDFFGVTDFFFGVNGFFDEGYYYFNQTVDLGAIYTSRVTADYSAFALNANSDVMARPDFFGLSDFFDTDPSSWSLDLQIRYTSDDPASSPVSWSNWATFITGDYNARAIEFRIKLVSLQFGVTPVVSSLTATVNMPDEDRADKDLLVTTAGLNVIFNPEFRTLKGLGINAESLDTGDYYRTSNKSGSGFTIQFFNSSGTPVERTFDYIAKGYGRKG